VDRLSTFHYLTHSAKGKTKVALLFKVQIYEEATTSLHDDKRSYQYKSNEITKKNHMFFFFHHKHSQVLIIELGRKQLKNSNSFFVK